jgi:hypothetical protein
MAEQRRINIKVTSNAKKVTKGLGDETVKQGKRATGALGRIKGMASGIGGAFSAATGGVRAFSAALVSSGVGAIVVAMGSLVALLGKALTTSKDFEAALSGLKAITGATNEEMAALSNNALELGRSTAFTASQVVELQTEFSKLGFTTGEILNATEATLALAAASGTDLATAAVVAGNTLRGFGLDASETGRVTDVMAKSFTSSALDMVKFQESMKLVAPIAKTVKVPIEEASAALAVLADRGVAGSLAGTQLRRIMSDLATKTGKDFATSLEITADRLSKAATTADKLAIAKELVGDRAKGSLIALAENRDVLTELTKEFENAGGAAQAMADEKLNNLNGDLTKLSSAWEGFLLGLEDGEGIMNKVARGAVQFLTDGLGFLTRAIASTGDFFAVNFASMKRVAASTKERLGETFNNIGLNIERFALKAKEKISEIPLIGKAVDKEALQANLKAVESELQASNDRLSQLAEDAAKEDERRAAHYAERKANRETAIAVAAAKKRDEQIEQFEEGAAAESEEKTISRLETFKRKLFAKEEELDADNDMKKNELARTRHLRELETLKLNETEKRELVERINSYYDARGAKIKAEQDAKAKQKASDEAQKAEEEAQRLHQQELNRKLELLDATARIFGEQTALGKAALVAKQVLLAKELVMEAKSTIAKAKLKAAEAGGEVAKGTAKAAATLNPIVIAGWALTAAGIVATIASAFKASKQAAAEAGASGVSAPDLSSAKVNAPSAPAFNVIGRTDAGSQLVANAVQQSNSQPIKAFVVENEISAAQMSRQRREGQASLG